MRPKLQKQSVLKLAGRIIPGAKRRGALSREAEGEDKKEVCMKE
jgi:hypothetical protein